MRSHAWFPSFFLFPTTDGSLLSLRAIDFLGRCQNPSGGFAGGPGQLSHLAPTYAAVNALVILGTQEAYDAINRFVSWKAVFIALHHSLFSPPQREDVGFFIANESV